MNSRGSILIVDDEPVVRESLEQWFGDEGYAVHAASNGKEALNALAAQPYDLALLDIKMPGMDGMELQGRIKEADPELPVIVMTGYASVETAVRALKQGAYDYITKPVDPDELSHAVGKAIEHNRARREIAQLRESMQELLPSSDIIGNSIPMKKVQEFVDMAAPTDSTVLITGESGTGKEVVARAIHQHSMRRNMPMVVIHCGALTDTLLESELFGHERGAFTGAQYRKKGKFEAADGGTVFLDEIADISLRMQTDLLRVLQQKEITRVGGNQSIKVDFRCIAATNKRLEDLVQAGTFRPDLYYRLHVLCVELPPLRDRREDIPLLASQFISKLCANTNRTAIPEFRPAALDLLVNYDWPGNVRELENAVERALVTTRGPVLGEEAFSFLARALEPCLCSANGSTQSLDEVERVHILRVFEECKHNHSKTARLLGIDRTTLYAKLRRYGVK
ncbi:MAG: sigma-54-dependent Fis family transcriptional regulator [Acidobacteria bacterium]|nr:sigma-54-dependent Fis family transcriptional regulator [Acidobacteriota bacterium]